ncbi:hypothetical protein MKX03_008047 [Papaver bracteatum]|nr:hypothetical protein MKX03_008047 [Papaver bracteatum]
MSCLKVKMKVVYFFDSDVISKDLDYSKIRNKCHMILHLLIFFHNCARMDKADSSQLPELLPVRLQMISEEEPLANSDTSEDVTSNSYTYDMMPNSCTMEPLGNSNTKELVVACPIRSFEKMSHPEEEQTDAGDELTSTGSFATEKNSASLRDEDTLFERKAEPVHVP